jgi:aryl-alcohol dehydrogenase-like predicted oxidoreductase
MNGVPEGSRACVVTDLRRRFTSKDFQKKYGFKLKALVEVAESINIPLSQLALAWVLRRPEISSTIMGASKPEQVISNAAASEVTLSKNVLQRIEEILDNKPTSHFR